MGAGPVFFLIDLSIGRSISTLILGLPVLATFNWSHGIGLDAAPGRTGSRLSVNLFCTP
jgi:hypothetical protein